MPKIAFGVDLVFGDALFSVRIADYRGFHGRTRIRELVMPRRLSQNYR